MDLTLSTSEVAFRDELRNWLDAHPLDPAPEKADAKVGWLRDWQRTLHRDGWVAPHWPKEYGGRGATQTEAAIYFEELGRARKPLPANLLGLLMGGPTLMIWGTAQQRKRLLPPILSAEEIWCQGFSEPDAGSDLASLRTTATRDGDAWVINGQKVWTSLAQYSKWCMLLARTDTTQPKHQGLTYFLLDMAQPGVTVRPLRQLTGEPQFNELFFDAARVPDDNVVGGVGDGWKVALTTLMNERSGIGFALQVALRGLLDDLRLAAEEHGAPLDPSISDQLADMHIRCETIRLPSAVAQRDGRFADYSQAPHGRKPDPTHIIEP